MDIPNMSGIYVIRNAANGKKYIGSAVNVRSRYSKHLSLLRAGRHHSRHLQSAWNKYGEDSFLVELVEPCAPEALVEREQRWIDELAPEYNAAPKAGSTLGYRYTPVQRAKLSEARRGSEVRARHVTVVVEGEVVTLRDLAKRLGVPYQRLNNRRKQGLTPEELVATATVEDLHSIPERRAAWFDSIREGVAKREYRPMSAEGRARQRKAVVEYNRTRGASDEFRKNMSEAQKKRKTVERFALWGENLTVLEMAERYDVCRHVLRKRLNAGWSVEDAVTRPVLKKPRKK